MAWSWSHTQEAYDCARRNMEKLPIDELRWVAVDWKVLRALQTIDSDLDATGVPSNAGFVEDLAVGIISEWEEDTLKEYVWEQMEEHATCSNGGWEAWVDPEGYVTVSFSEEGKDANC